MFLYSWTQPHPAFSLLPRAFTSFCTHTYHTWAHTHFNTEFCFLHEKLERYDPIWEVWGSPLCHCLDGRGVSVLCDTQHFNTASLWALISLGSESGLAEKDAIQLEENAQVEPGTRAEREANYPETNETLMVPAKEGRIIWRETSYFWSRHNLRRLFKTRTRVKIGFCYLNQDPAPDSPIVKWK